MASIRPPEIDFETYCSCGAALNAEFDYNGDLIVKPCEDCIQRAEDEARSAMEER